MPVIYNGFSIRPAPFATITESFDKLGDGRVVGSTTTVLLKGTIVSTKTNDTDTPLDIEQRLSVIIQKQAALRQVFAQNGMWLEIQGLDGSQAVKFIATVDSIEFDEGPWVEICGYTVTLHGETAAGEEGANDHIESASESWQFEEGDGPHTYRATHTLQAKGKTYYDNGSGSENFLAWQYAKAFVTNKLGLNFATRDTPWSPQSGGDIFTSGNILPETGLLPFNRIISENVDEAEGQYSVTESFFLSVNNYWEEYTVSVRKETGNPFVRNIVSISGVIHGLTTQLHDPEGRYANALARWNTVQSLLYARAGSYATDTTLNIKHTSQSVDSNPNEGTVSYQFEYDDRILINNTYEWYNVIQETNLEDNKTTVRIDGVITGVRYFDDIFNPQLPYERAYTQFQTVKNLMLARCISESDVPDLKAFPLSASVTPNKEAGSISYAFSFDNRLPETVRDEFTVSTRFSREDGRTVIAINGTITGLRSANPTWPFGAYSEFERYNNAKDYFAGIENGLVGLAARYVDITAVNPLAFSKTVSHVPNGGQLSYEYEFNSMPAPCVVGALSENITITDDAATKVIAVIPVPGRSRGPVMQDIGTVKEKRRSVSIEVVMPTSFLTTNMCSVSGAPVVDITPYAPTGNPVYLEQDQTSWSPSTGHFSRIASWIYE